MTGTCSWMLSGEGRSSAVNVKDALRRYQALIVPVGLLYGALLLVLGLLQVFAEIEGAPLAMEARVIDVRRAPSSVISRSSVAGYIRIELLTAKGMLTSTSPALFEKLKGRVGEQVNVWCVPRYSVLGWCVGLEPRSYLVNG